jgi:hypothetical protein
MATRWQHFLLWPLLTALACASLGAEEKSIGVGAKPIPGAEVVLDGSRQMLDALWTYWEGPRFASSLPIKWKIVDDPVDIARVLTEFVPLSKLMAEQIMGLRNWAKGRARLATSSVIERRTRRMVV